MSKGKRTTYDSLEVRTDESFDGNGVSVEERLRRIDYQQWEKRKLIPTDDEEVRDALRLIKEPDNVQYEDPFSRRERLSELLFLNKDHMEIFKAHLQQEELQKSTSDDEKEEEEFYTPASNDLIEARKFLINYTNVRSKERLEREIQNTATSDVSRIINERRGINTRLKKFELAGSQITSSRPVSQARLSPNDKFIATANWNGGIGILDSYSLDVICSADGVHQGKIGGINWSPDGKMIVSGAEDGLVRLFIVEQQQIQESSILKGHERRVAGTAFHPSQLYVASASFDMTWRLWDLNTGKELLLQEGHGKEVFCVAFQNDGSLLCSAGLDHCGIIWDIRSGKSTMILKGHAKPIYAVDWSPNGYTVATGAGDGTVKIWDLRKSSEEFTILAHNNVVSSVSFDKEHGNVLVSGGYDKKVNVFSCDNWIKLNSLEGHTDKVLCSDISKDASFVISSGWDRSIKLWKIDN
ncbi:hypothetical protein HG535_0C06130 [Zygotorulaspora mrakii]|uniref:Pre-mRNA processing factor 4 (PRP4)-like domain-containing protein n=1 Tax=Zygotorulaspora mrakii TaxID=42260 RepID=A0A7H9B0U1_ZYGMR|nr:uncharacterized protein HG535_0C06130 [Zygotorulaspora mrakii]QLG72258.1 hypothetical protein HG535_0C06130 [Zygotorulaspora mrakii]